MNDYAFLNWNHHLCPSPPWECSSWSYFGYGGAPSPGTRFLIKLSGVGIVGYGIVTGKPFKVKNSDWPYQIPISVTRSTIDNPLSVAALKMLGFKHLPWPRQTAMVRLKHPEDGLAIQALFDAMQRRQFRLASP
jgi:hypothetical protein